MRIAVLHPQTPFVRGGAETHAESVVRALRENGHDAEIVSAPFKWYPAPELVHQIGMWRSFDLSESAGVGIDMVIALKFPAYLVKHDNKVVWLIHQHRTAYELWDHPVFADLSRQPDGPHVRELIHRADRAGLGEARRIFTNSANVKRRLERSLGLGGEVLYHRSPMTSRLLDEEEGEIGDYVLYPSRFDRLKRQDLLIGAMRNVRSGVRAILVGAGPDEAGIRRQIADAKLGTRVDVRTAVSDDELAELYKRALAVYYGPFDEDFGYVTLEAFAAARPVVTLSDSGGPLEFVRSGETGIVAEPNADAIAQALDRLHGDSALAEKMGRAGRETVLDLVPDWPSIVDRLLS
jgi:glycosyltransferase involved in cell wall biosynthesis